MNPKIVQYPNSNPVAAINILNAPSAIVNNNAIIAQTSILTISSVPVIGIRLSGISNNAILENNDVTSDYAGIRLNGPSGVKIQDNQILAAVYPIDTRGSSSNFFIENNELIAETNWRASAVFAESPAGIFLGGIYSGGTINQNIINSENTGISLNEQANIIIKNNEIEAPFQGIQVNRGPNVLVKNNLIKSEKMPIWIADSPDLIVSENTVTTSFPTDETALNNITAIGVTSFNEGGFSGGLIEKNIVFSDFRGIAVGGNSVTTCPSNIVVSENFVYKAHNGIEANYATRVTISDNLVFAELVQPSATGLGIIVGGGTTTSSECTVKDNEIYSSGTGISIKGSDTNVTDNKIYKSQTGIFFNSTGSNQHIWNNFINSTGNGINLSNFNYVTVQGNTINALGTGISSVIPALAPDGSVGYWQNPRIVDNFMNNTQTGIVAVRFKDGIVQNNLINATARMSGSTPSGFGITISGTNNLIIGNMVKGTFLTGINLNGMISNTVTSIGNVFSDNIVIGGAITDDTGIYLNNATSTSSIHRNHISGVDVGIFFNVYSSNNEISNNTIKENAVGVRLYYSSDNKFFHNNFLYNLIQVESVSATNVWDVGYPSGGNYWSDYTGTDGFHGVAQNIPGRDGLGDTPYVIDGSNRDNYPLTSEWPLRKQIIELGPVKIWVGLKNSDDIGIKFDLKAEVYKNGVLVASGQLNSVAGGSSGFNNAKLNSIPLSLLDDVFIFPGDSVSVKVYVRNAAVGSGKNSGTARLWYNDAQANSRLDLAADEGTSIQYLLNGFVTGSSPGAGPKKTIDVAAGKKGSVFKLFGTWTVTLP
jgi:parallel beta-helix repeat protein